MAQQNDEHMLTITLSPKFFNTNRIASQLKATYHYMRKAFKSGMGCLEFTEQGNVHYHIKTQDDISDIHVFFDTLKNISVKKDGMKTYVFGFTKCDKTMKEKNYKDYTYITKMAEKSDQTLKKLQLLDKYHSIWEYTDTFKTSFNVIRQSKKKVQKPSNEYFKVFQKGLGNLPSGMEPVDEDSDTFEFISTGLGGYFKK